MKNPFIYVEIIFFRSNFWWKLANRRNGWKSRKNKMRSIFQKKGSGECVTKKKRTIKTNCLKLLRSLLYPIDNCKSVRQQIEIGWISKPTTLAPLLQYICRLLKLQDFYKATYCIMAFIQLLLYSTTVVLDFGLWSNYSLKSFFFGRFTHESIFSMFLWTGKSPITNMQCNSSFSALW